MGVALLLAGTTPTAAQRAEDLFRQFLQVAPLLKSERKREREREAPPSDPAAVQEMLNALGYDAGPVDGSFGRRSLNALNDFQRDRGLPQTDEVDASTARALTAASRAGPGAAPPRTMGGPTHPVEVGLPPGVPSSAPGAPAYADFVHMALMSDVAAYRAEATRTGLAYIAATGGENDCRRLYDVSTRGDEFVRREYFQHLAQVAHRALADLPGRPRRFEIAVEATYALGEYDFDRKGFPFAPFPQPQLPIIAGGAIPLPNSSSRGTCRSGYYTLAHHLQKQGASINTELSGLRVQHDAVRGIDLLPMPPDEARAFRETNAQFTKAGVPGGNRVLLKARLVVEPRDQGRGPLKGRIVAVTAHAPHGDRLLHRWNVEGSAPTTAQRSREPMPLSAENLAALIGPAAEPIIDPRNFDMAAARYFSENQLAINAGNLPRQSPLPIDVIRGHKPELVVALNREQLRASLREGVPLPATMYVEQIISPKFEEGKGLHFARLENDPGEATGAAALSQMKLSGRDLPLYSQFSFLRLSSGSALVAFRQVILAAQSLNISLELDRIVSLPAISLSVEQAAAHGLLSFGGGSTPRGNIVLRWEFVINDVRAEGRAAIVVSADISRLSYRWASSGAVLHEVALDTLATVKQLRHQADAALPAGATAENVATPPAGARLGAEMMDLLQLRYQPETVDDRVIHRMMINRFQYEAASKVAPTEWGQFFRDVSKPLDQSEWTARLPEFRRWSEARAAAMPHTLTIVLPLADTPNGKAAPFERSGKQNSVRCNEPSTEPEKGAVMSRICAFLDAAWRLPEPQLFLPGYGERQGPRFACGNGDQSPYCLGMYNAHVGLKLPMVKIQQDVVRVDRLPILDASLRGMRGRLALELVVEPTGLTAEARFPESIYQQAERVGFEVGQPFGLRVPPTGTSQLREKVMLLSAKAISARIVDLDTGRVVAEPPLARSPQLPMNLLEMQQPTGAGREVVGLKLGMSFAEADRTIRAHMQVGRLLFADRRRQLSNVSGQIAPYTSGRMYASAAGNEVIAIFDEPPSATETVLGLWRILRVPHGATDLTALKATLAQRYGEPRVAEVSLPFMRTGVAFLWSAFANSTCQSIDFIHQTNLWSDENGSAAAPPPRMHQHLYPRLGGPGTHGFLDGKLQPLPLGSFCTAFLGVRYASQDGRNHGEHNGVELVTWLTDQRSYATHFYRSLKSPVIRPPSAETPSSGIKF